MHEDGGFTRSYRRKWKNPVFRNFRDCGIWSWLTDMAAWRDTVVRFQDQMVSLSAGQLVASERFIAEGFCCDRQVVRRLLDALEARQMITRQQTHRATIITICNYAKYQGNECAIEDDEPILNPTANPSQTQFEPSPNPNKKEVKESKKVKSISRDDPEFVEWYEVYPLKKDPGRAAQAYRSARKLASAADLIDGARRYHAECDGKEPRFIKHPATWLNAQSWRNESDLMRSSNGQPSNGFGGFPEQRAPGSPPPALAPGWKERLGLGPDERS